MAWRWLGSVMQPLLGTTNYLLGPLKPVHKPVVLPTGIPMCPDTAAMLQDRTSAVRHLLSNFKMSGCRWP